MQDKTQNKDCGKTPKDSNDKYFLAMSNVAIAHPLFKARLFEYFDFDIKKTFECDTNDIKLADEYWGGLSCPRDFFKERDNTDPDKFYDNFMELSSGENLSKGKPLKDTAFSEPLAKGIKYITYDSGNYPAMLKGIADFPLMLYYKGDFSGVNFDKTVAFVGSRKASTYAREILGTIISAFKGLDITIVSGLAEGVDAKSHSSALENGLKTIGVIGSGFKFQYPSSNKKLYEEIEAGGGIIFSEYPYEIPPMPHQFPQRNRIVTGLSYGTVVGEARMKSGAMISGKLTLEQGRELMCVPGLISNPNTEGVYHLLRNGASMVTTGADILDVLGWDIKIETAGKENLEGLEKQIYEAISIEARAIEELALVLSVDINDLMVNLTSMELKGLIKQAGGSYFIKG